MNDLLTQITALLKQHGGSPDTSVFEQALRLVLAALHSETGTIHLLDSEKQTLHLAAQVGLPSQMLDIVKTIPVGKGIAGETVARGGPVTMCNLQTDTSGVAKPGAKQTGVGGALCVPLRNGETIVGTIGLGTMRQHEYTPDETRTLEEVGHLIGAHLPATGAGSAQ